MKKLLLPILFILMAGSAIANDSIYGFCQNGNITVLTGGQTSSTKVMGSYPSCTVTVYNTGTSNLSTIYSNNGGTPQSNPFTASSTGLWKFFAANGRYDVTLSGTGLVTYNIPSILLQDNTSSLTFSEAITFSDDLIAPYIITAAGTSQTNSAAGDIVLPMARHIRSANLANNNALKMIGYQSDDVLQIGNSSSTTIYTSGGLYPSTNQNLHLGGASNKWMDLYSDSIYVSNGSAAAPSIAPYGTTTGLAFASNVIIVGTGGTERARFFAGGIAAISYQTYGSAFNVNSSGNITSINGVVYSWPASSGASNSILTYNGGFLTWSNTLTGNWGLNSTSYGSGTGVFAMGDVSVAPSGTPTAGGVLYSQAGALKWKGSSGTITTLAPP